MNKKLGPILLVFGYVALYASFLFSAKNLNTAILMFLGGTVVVIAGLIVIIVGKTRVITKSIWIVSLVIAVAFGNLAIPALKKSSYLIYLYSNEEQLTEINEILVNHPGDFYMHTDKITTDSMQLTEKETQRLIELGREVDSYMIWKSESEVYYGLFGFMGTRTGITYCIVSDCPIMPYSPMELTENWSYQ
jgi:hypothetical protein